MAPCQPASLLLHRGNSRGDHPRVLRVWPRSGLQNCGSGSFTIGNIDDNRFEDIWNGAPRRKIALALLNGRPEEACTGCPLIGGADYEKTEGFLMPEDSRILAEKSKNIGKLPSLEGLEEAFQSGVAALKGGNHQEAVRVFSSLAARFQDFFEIWNNLAVAYYHLGNLERCREILDDVGRIPHFERIVQANLNALPPSSYRTGD